MAKSSDAMAGPRAVPAGDARRFSRSVAGVWKKKPSVWARAHG